MVGTRDNQLLPQLLMEQFDTSLTQCRHNEYMHEEVWFTKIIDKITAMTLMELFDTLPTQCIHIEHMHEGVCLKNL